MAVFAGRIGTTRCLVCDTANAAELLTRHWPLRVERGPKFHAAWRACYAALQGRSGPERARKAFIAAAKEAGILAT